jgi:hypothetical protein
MPTAAAIREANLRKRNKGSVTQTAPAVETPIKREEIPETFEMTYRGLFEIRNGELYYKKPHKGRGYTLVHIEVPPGKSPYKTAHKFYIEEASREPPIDRPMFVKDAYGDRGYGRI